MWNPSLKLKMGISGKKGTPCSGKTGLEDVDKHRLLQMCPNVLHALVTGWNSLLWEMAGVVTEWSLHKQEDIKVLTAQQGQKPHKSEL